MQARTPTKPLTLRGKQIRTPKSAPAYRTKSYQSNVDETLFGVPTRYAQQTETKRMSDEKEWDPPWVTSPGKKGVPLLWTPFEYKGFNGMLTTEQAETRKVSSKPTTPRSARSHNKYRLRGHTPTYVDETLFGSKVDEPSFQAPWDNENNNNSTGRQLLWSPQVKAYPLTPRSEAATLDRPGSRLGEYEDPYIPPTPRDANHSNHATPVIRQRPGSSIKTPSKARPASAKQVKQKLNFGTEEDPETKQIIDRALHLAKVTRDAALAERRNSDGFSPWRRPASARERPSPRVPGVRTAHLSDYASDEDDILSATGVRMPLSARSDRSSRPSSVRLRSRSAQRCSPGVSDRPSFKP